MTRHFDEGDQLARLVRDAADQVQPRPALDAIRARTASSPKESAMTLARTWILGGLGGAVATAAVIGGVYVATTSGDGNSQDPGPVDTPSGSVALSPTPSVSPSESDEPTGTSDPSPSGDTIAVPVYYAGETPAGLRLYREFVRVDSGNRLAAAVERSILGNPAGDPDYRTLWPTGVSVNGVHVDGQGDNLELTIDLDGDVHDRPSGMSEEAASLAVEQLIYTVQGAAGSGRPPVQLLLDGKHTDTVLGVPTSEPLANGPVLDTLSLMNLTTPAEGDVVKGDKLEVSGVASSFEANVIVKLQRFEGTHVVFQKPLTAAGWMGEKLFPFSGSFDIADVPAGTYILTASTDDPTGGTEGNGPYVDSKVIEIR